MVCREQEFNTHLHHQHHHKYFTTTSTKKILILLVIGASALQSRKILSLQLYPVIYFDLAEF